MSICFWLTGYRVLQVLPRTINLSAVDEVVTAVLQRKLRRTRYEKVRKFSVNTHSHSHGLFLKCLHNGAGITIGNYPGGRRPTI